MPLPPHPFEPELNAAFRTTRDAFIEDAVEQALDSAWADGLALNFKENGMTERTRYGQQVEDEAADEAADLFDKIFKLYSTHAKNFKQEENGPSCLVDYIEMMIDETELSNEEQEALERITATHLRFLETQKENQAKNKAEQRDLARFLLHAPLEFADQNSGSLFSAIDQQHFTRLLGHLRQLAAV